MDCQARRTFLWFAGACWRLEKTVLFCVCELQRGYVMRFAHLIYAICAAANPNGWAMLRCELSWQRDRRCDCSSFLRTTKEQRGSMSFIKLTSAFVFFVTRRSWEAGPATPGCSRASASSCTSTSSAHKPSGTRRHGGVHAAIRVETGTDGFRMVHHCTLGRNAEPTTTRLTQTSFSVHKPASSATAAPVVGHHRPAIPTSRPRLFEVRTVVCDGVQRVCCYEDGVRVSTVAQPTAPMRQSEVHPVVLTHRTRR
ncbi:uncharacterized protein LOC142776207 [Rhipicephalus microplus]|uniref:uncharacterized protein LOC142776207 n=1 Tax=Rhipicephalus microplus TaxID=6941 RepID=UPI003F6AEE0B